MKKVIVIFIGMLLYTGILIANSKTSGIVIQKIYEDYSLDKIKSMAKNGDSNAQYDLSERYNNGIGGVKKDQIKAIKWVKLAAAQNNSGAQNSLGYYYQFGQGVEKNLNHALKYYKLAAEQGHRIALNNVGTFMLNQKLYKKAAKLFQKSSELGYIPAKNNLAILYDKGQGVQKNQKKAFNIYKEVALSGESNAQVNLAGLYYMGQGTSENLFMAMVWYEIAIMNGHIYIPRSTQYKYIIQHMSNAEIAKAKKLAQICYDSHYKQCEE